jgi:hypothetical protein
MLASPAVFQSHRDIAVPTLGFVVAAQMDCAAGERKVRA